VSGFTSCVRTLKNRAGEPLGVDVEELRQSILKDRFEYVQKSTSFNLGAMFTSAFGILGELKYFGYQCFYAPEGSYYVTSDCPVFTIQPDGKGQATIGMGFGWPEGEVYFPLSKRTCLRMKRGISPMGRLVEAGRVAEINKFVMVTADRYLYSSQSHKRIARLFDERGCKVKAGTNAFMPEPGPTQHF
jgi:uncharacterized protein DUF4238